MIDEFVEKLNRSEYISNHLYEYVMNNDKKYIPEDFDIDQYNNKVLDLLYAENKEYFEHMYDEVDPNIHLDEEQCKAILADEKYSLIIAGAGTGKTTTMTAKVKYLVDKKHVIPERILVMSFTRKTTEELSKRIEADFDIPAHITTFHSLGLEYIREIFSDKKCVVIDKNKRNEISLEYFREIFKDKNKIKEIIENFDIVKQMYRFVFGNFFLENYGKYETYDELVNTYVAKKINEAKRVGIRGKIDNWIDGQLLRDDKITTINGEFVKSGGELIIANFLYMHGLDYSYEKVYNEMMEHNSIYRPDFTVDYGGEKIYIEYFGMDDDKYNKIRQKKEEQHRKRNNKFISISRMPIENIAEKLDRELKKFGIIYNEKSDEDVYEKILRLYPLAQVYPFVDFLYNCVRYRKESLFRENKQIVVDYINSLEDNQRENVEIQYKYIKDFYEFYYKQCFGGEIFYFDFADLLYYADKYLEKLTNDDQLRFDYIIIDEYQDVSKTKYELTHKIADRNNAVVSAVGDDWQSIYGFSGSRIEYIYKFEEYFKGAKLFKITKTYRNSQELTDYTGKFIMQNSDQIKKKLISDKHIDDPVVFEYYDSSYGPYGEIDKLKEVILKINEEFPNHKILVLGRTNRMIDRLLTDEVLIDGIGSKIVYSGYENIDIEGMTMHKSKGLTFDEVIIVGLNKSFPSNKYGINWYENLYRNKTIEESIPFAEERRIFYVALTRTKNRVYLLCDKNPKYRSEFISEIENIINGN